MLKSRPGAARTVLAAVAAAAAAASMQRERQRERPREQPQERPQERPRERPREQLAPRGGSPLDRRRGSGDPAGLDRGGPSVTFAGLEVTGPAAEWLLEQQQIAQGRFAPSPIQDLAMRRIFEGESLAIQAPTGSGKTLAFMLPLLLRLEKELQRFPRPGMRMLVLAPTADLQMQTSALARALLGSERAQAVTMLRRDQDNTSVSAAVVVATPRQVLELLATPLTAPVWTKAIAYVDMVVVDEADRLVDKWTMYQRKKRAREEKVDPCTQLLETIAIETGKVGRGDAWQLVAASATLNRRTQRALKFTSGIDISLLRAAGAQMPDWVPPSLAGGQYGEGTSNWPEGLVHRFRAVEPFWLANVMPAACAAIMSVEVERVLVILGTTGTAGRVSSAIFGLNPVAAQLRFRLEPKGFKVMTCSAAVEAATAMLAGRGEPGQEQGQREVIVGTREAVRGIHLDNVGAVVIVGELPSVEDYVHCAGRTCRYQPGRPPAGGTVFSICPNSVGDRLWHWGKLTGFKPVEDVPSKSTEKSAAKIAAEIKDEEGSDLESDLEVVLAWSKAR